MAIRQITKPIWITSDDKPFETHSEAVLHEAESQNLERVEKHLDSIQAKTKKQMSDRSRAWQRNCIMGFLQEELSEKVLIETVKEDGGND